MSRAASRSCVIASAARGRDGRRGGCGGHGIAAEIVHRRVDAAAFDRHAGCCETQLDTGERAEKQRLVDVSEMADTEDLARDLAKAGAKRNVKTIENDLADLV